MKSSIIMKLGIFFLVFFLTGSIVQINSYVQEDRGYGDDNQLHAAFARLIKID